MEGAPFLNEAMAKEGRKLVNPAVHVDLWTAPSAQPTSSTITGITLRVFPRIHKPATTIFQGGQCQNYDFGRSSLLNVKSLKKGSLLKVK
jgi:hypothetical protein